MLTVFVLYFIMLLTVSLLIKDKGNGAFFRGNRKSPWPLVAFGMLGASLSGVTFISVPGMVMNTDMTYLQMCLGFIPGYIAVAFILLPLYYRLGLTSIYGYLQSRFGQTSYRTGAMFFILSKLTGAAARLYLVCLILHQYIFSDIHLPGAEPLQLPYITTVIITLLLIWLYTRGSGIKAIVWTDTLQTFCLLAALIFIIFKATAMLDMGIGEAFSAVWHDSKSRIFEFSDWGSRQNFWKQFMSGAFIVVVMTGLDQDMMQKNLTCRTLRSAQKNVCSYGMFFLPINFLFLSLGVLMTMLYAKTGTSLPDAGDRLLPDFIAGGMMGQGVMTLFTIGIVASSFSSADSALTALTTSFCIDIMGLPADTDNAAAVRTRRIVHIAMCAAFAACIMAIYHIGSKSVIDAIYTIAGYTYGPLLGLFAFGMTTKCQPDDRLVPVVAVASPVICALTDYMAATYTGYRFGYELLMLNGILTFIGLWIISHREATPYSTNN